MRILLTNDDGVYAPGFAVLRQIAAKFSDDIWTCAPSEEQSGAGHSLTLSRPLRIRQFDDRNFAVDGTPTDSVLMALAKIMKDNPPDLILSGVNRGANLAEDVSYSGTVSAAKEGTLAGIPSIAMSQCYTKDAAGNNVSFDTALQWAERTLRPLIEVMRSGQLAKGTLLNVNFPPCGADKVRGISTVALGSHDYGRVRILTNKDPRGFDYHWFGLTPTQETPAQNSDLEAVRDNMVSVTPLHLDMTHHQSLETLGQIFAQK